MLQKFYMLFFQIIQVKIIQNKNLDQSLLLCYASAIARFKLKMLNKITIEFNNDLLKKFIVFILFLCGLSYKKLFVLW